MDSNTAYSPKQSGLLEAVELPPDIMNANKMADRFENQKFGHGR